MIRTLAMALIACMLAAIAVSAQEILIWYDDQGVAHQATSPAEIPARHRPQVQGIQTALTPAVTAEAQALGARIAADPGLYRDGLGLFHPFRFELDMEESSGYLFVGTKYNLVKARAAAAGGDGKIPFEYVRSVIELDSLPIGFYAWNFKPVLLMLVQDGTFIKGEEGFPEGVDPKLKVPAYVMTFPYEAIDFSKPVHIQLYSREGNVVQFEVNLPSLK